MNEIRQQHYIDYVQKCIADQVQPLSLSVWTSDIYSAAREKTGRTVHVFSEKLKARVGFFVNCADETAGIKEANKMLAKLEQKLAEQGGGLTQAQIDEKLRKSLLKRFVSAKAREEKNRQKAISTLLKVDPSLLAKLLKSA